MRRLMEMAEHKPRRLSRLIENHRVFDSFSATGKRMPRGERKKLTELIHISSVFVIIKDFFIFSCNDSVFR